MPTTMQRARPVDFNPETGTASAADHLRVGVDMNDDAITRPVVNLRFSDYPGLEAEWNAWVAGGTTTDVLDAAVESKLGLTPGSVSSGAKDDPEDYSSEIVVP
jgi:hypothetical protein